MELAERVRGGREHGNGVELIELERPTLTIWKVIRDGDLRKTFAGILVSLSIWVLFVVDFCLWLTFVCGWLLFVVDFCLWLTFVCG